MLVVTRSLGQSIRIGSDIKNFVRKIQNDRATLTILAPEKTQVVREKIVIKKDEKY